MSPYQDTIDLCLITKTPLSAVIEHLHAHNVAVEEGVVRRTGAVGAIDSIYIRDRDGNLLEISNLIENL
jgi:catechol 2,3-dioxygenase-like lactoylglutathione lyase family enzyme